MRTPPSAATLQVLGLPTFKACANAVDQHTKLAPRPATALHFGALSRHTTPACNIALRSPIALGQDSRHANKAFSAKSSTAGTAIASIQCQREHG